VRCQVVGAGPTAEPARDERRPSNPGAPTEGAGLQSCSAGQKRQARWSSPEAISDCRPRDRIDLHRVGTSPQAVGPEIFQGILVGVRQATQGIGGDDQLPV
jgi:hypothetical protein